MHRRRHPGPELRRGRADDPRLRAVDARPGRRRRGPGRHPHALGFRGPVPRHPQHPRRRRGLRPRRRGRPGRARRAGVRAGTGRGRLHRRRDVRHRPRSTRPPRAAARPDGRRRLLDHLHLRHHRPAQGRGCDTPQRGRVRRRRVPAVPDRRAAGPRRPRTGRTVGGLRRLVRGDVARLGPRGVPRSRPAHGRQVRPRPRPVVAGPPDHRHLHGPDPGLDVARFHAHRHPDGDPRRRGVPARTGRAPDRRGPRGVEHLRPHRDHRRRVRRPVGRARRGADRTAARRLGPRGGRRRRPAGGLRGVRRTGHRWCRPGALPRPREGRREVRALGRPGLGPRLPLRRRGPARGRRAVLQRPGRRPGQDRRPSPRAG